MIYLDVHETSALILMLSKMSLLKEILKCKKVLKLEFRSDSWRKILLKILAKLKAVFCMNSQPPIVLMYTEAPLRITYA